MSLVDTIETGLEALIAAGDLKPGQRLNETNLAGRFNASRTPVREAISRLATKGRVTIESGRGAYVAQLDAAQLIVMFEALSELEATCARLAARRITAQELDSLEAVHEGYRAAAEAGDVDLYFKQSLAFHDEILLLAKNKVLSDIAKGLAEKVRPYRRQTIGQPRRIKQSWDEHTNVLDALRRGDPIEAERYMREHTGIVADNAMNLIQLIGAKDVD